MKNDRVEDILQSLKTKNSLAEIEFLLKNDLSVLVYSLSNDVTALSAGTIAWIRNMDWEGHDLFFGKPKNYYYLNHTGEDVLVGSFIASGHLSKAVVSHDYGQEASANMILDMFHSNKVKCTSNKKPCQSNLDRCEFMNRCSTNGFCPFTTGKCICD
jgi:hypothetical protein